MIHQRIRCCAERSSITVEHTERARTATPHWCYTLVNLTRTRIHPVLMFFLSRQRCLDSFHPRVLIVRTVAPEQAALIIHGSRRLKNCKHSAAHRRSPCRGDARQTVVHKQCPTPRRSRLGCSTTVQYENEVVDMPVVKGRRADSDARDAAMWLLVTEVADSTALPNLHQTHGTCRCET